MAVKTFLIRADIAKTLSDLVNKKDITNIHKYLPNAIYSKLGLNNNFLCRFNYGRKRADAFNLNIALDIVPGYCIGFMNMLFCDDVGKTDFITLYFKHTDIEYIDDSTNNLIPKQYSNWIVPPPFPEIENYIH